MSEGSEARRYLRGRRRGVLAEQETGIVARMNTEHAHDLRDFCRHRARAR